MVTRVGHLTESVLSEHDSDSGWEVWRGPGDLFKVRHEGSGLDRKGQSGLLGWMWSRSGILRKREGEIAGCLAWLVTGSTVAPLGEIGILGSVPEVHRCCLSACVPHRWGEGGRSGVGSGGCQGEPGTGLLH